MRGEMEIVHQLQLELEWVLTRHLQTNMSGTSWAEQKASKATFSSDLFLSLSQDAGRTGGVNICEKPPDPTAFSYRVPKSYPLTDHSHHHPLSNS